MPLIPAAIKAKAEKAVYNKLCSEFSEEIAQNDKAKAKHASFAKAVAEAAQVIIEAILSDAQVAPNIPVSVTGSPAAQTGMSTGPGKIT